MTQELDWSQWITTGEAAALTGYSTSNFRKALARGLLQGRKKGRDWFLVRADVLRYAEEMRHLGAARHDPWRTGARQRSRDAAESA
ncbi:MAG: helix-turn-helix domain-containing protein [Chloroflexi bacterium]|nr:helix-turn-helix domain-containing protein [Chloroflexota bacterium]